MPKATYYNTKGERNNTFAMSVVQDIHKLMRGFIYWIIMEKIHFAERSVNQNVHGVVTKRDVTQTEEKLFTRPKWDFKIIKALKMQMHTPASAKSVVSASKSNRSWRSTWSQTMTTWRKMVVSCYAISVLVGAQPSLASPFMSRGSTVTGSFLWKYLTRKKKYACRACWVKCRI